MPSPEQVIQMQQHMHTLQLQVEQQQRLLQQAAHAGQARAPEMPKIRLPNPFNGAMGFVVDDWISEMQQQFAYYGARFPDDAAKVRFATAYFTGAAMHWWEHQLTACTSWDDFVTRLHGRFRPVHAAMLARQKLGKLRQRPGQAVNQYVGLFQSTLTPITDMGAMDQVHRFVNGLLGPLAAKVWEKHPANLVAAIDAAVSVEAMHNFGRAAMPYGHRPASSSTSYSSNPDAMDINNLEFEEAPVDAADAEKDALLSKMAAMEMRLNALSAGGASSRPSGQGGYRSRDRIAGLDPKTIKQLQSEGKCFRCKEKGHMKNECPKKPKNV